eukprot:2511803-Rhodomonas_salina.2
MHTETEREADVHTGVQCPERGGVLGPSSTIPACQYLHQYPDTRSTIPVNQSLHQYVDTRRTIPVYQYSHQYGETRFLRTR